MADHMNKYAEFISKQQKELRGSTVNTIEEAKSNSGEDPAVTKKIKSMKSIDGHDKEQSKYMARDADHEFTNGHEHVYMTHPAGRDADQYIVHNTKTGNTHVVISGVEEHEPPEHPNVSKATLKKIHKTSMSSDDL